MTAPSALPIVATRNRRHYTLRLGTSFVGVGQEGFLRCDGTVRGFDDDARRRLGNWRGAYVPIAELPLCGRCARLAATDAEVAP